MKLCILQAGEINPAIADNLPGYQDMYSALFAENAPSVDITYVQARHGELPALEDYSAYLVTGSPRGVYDSDEWIGELEDFIRTAYASGKTLIGVCFGHQIIANALGGKAEKSEKGWGVGIRSTPVTTSSDLIPENCESLDLLYMHQDQVTTLPEDATTLMGDDFCPIAAFHIGNQVLCFQGHPEFTKDVVGAIIDLRIDAIGSERGATGHESLKRDHQGAIIGQIFERFLTKANNQSGQRSTS